MRQGKTFMDVRIGEDWFGPARVKRIRITDVAHYFRYQARSMSGCRTIAGITGDWRPIDNIAQECLGYFKSVNIEGMRREALKLGIIPRF
jgi:hypothetical protein